MATERRGEQTMASALPKVCVIGAGSSGLPVVKALKERGIPVTCYEKTANIGGLWCIENKAAGATRRLRLTAHQHRHAHDGVSRLSDARQTSRRIPATRRFIATFAITRSTSSCIRISGSRHRSRTRIVATTASGKSRRLAARRGSTTCWSSPTAITGIRSGRSLIPASFTGEQIHSHSYRNPSDPIATRGKRVMVVGLGNSAVDIAAELGHRSAGVRCILSVRRGAWIMPKFVFGFPLTRPFVSVPHWVPWQLGGGDTRSDGAHGVRHAEAYGLPEARSQVAAIASDGQPGYLLAA